MDFSGGSKAENPEKNSVGNPRSNTSTDNKLSPHVARGWNRTWATSMCKRNLTLMTSAKFRLLLGVEDTGYVKLEHRLTNILFLLISTFFCPFDSHCFTSTVSSTPSRSLNLVTKHFGAEDHVGIIKITTESGLQKVLEGFFVI